jgi:Mn2+/Fe2+ NRAMP family transporter
MGEGFSPGAFNSDAHFAWNNHTDIFFLIAFIGWMPAPIDVAVWQSLWTIEKNKNLKLKLKDTLLDFKIGYIGTAVLAVCFLTLGAYVLYGSGKELSSSGAEFAGQLIDLYTVNIGTWSYYFIAVAALTTMFSTTLTCLDAYPRVMKPLTAILFPAMQNKSSKTDYQTWGWIAAVAAGALLLLSILNSTMRVMVDVATSISFITAPLLAILNYKAVTGKHMPATGRPKLWLRIYAITGIVFLSGFTLFYLYYNFL